MWLHICAYQGGLMMVLLWAMASGCSGGDGGTEQRGPGPNSKQRDPLADVRDLYRAGQPEKARELAMRLAEHALAAVEKESSLDVKLISVQYVVVTAKTVVECETDLKRSNGKPMDEPSRKAAAGFVEIMQRASKLASGLTASIALGERELGIQRQTDGLRVRVLENWILSHPRDQRESAFRAHQEFLESQGVKAADLVNAADTPPQPSADDRLLKRAKADTERIRKAVDAFYQALFTADAKAVRATVSKKTTDEQIRKLLAVSEQQKNELGDEKVVSVDLGKARVEAIAAQNGQVTVRVTDITVRREKGGRVSLINKVEVFAAANENERWVLCLK